MPLLGVPEPRPQVEQAGLAALEDDIFVSETLRVVREGREMLTRELTAMGCTVRPSQANFLMFDPPMDARTLFEELLKRGVILRAIGDTLAVCPPMIITEDGIDEIMDKLTRALDRFTEETGLA